MREKVGNFFGFAFLIFGILFSFYIVACTVAIFQDPSQHYTFFYLAIMFLTALLTLQKILLNHNLSGLTLWFNLIFFGSASLVAIFVAGYLRYNAIQMTITQPFFSGFDIVVGILMIVSLLIINWYHWGTLLTLMVSLAVAYVFFGHLIPYPMLSHGKFATGFSMSYMGLDTVSGIFWFVPLAADSIYLLIMYAALLIGIGMLPLVIELGKWMGQYVRGGAAFPAIVGSALTGSVMGQAVSNTMLTGQLTIPMMKRNGFAPNFAGAIESVASTSGQFLPPILGLAAFIIAAFLNIAYIEVAMAATLPAFLFVGGVVIAVLLEAQSTGLGYWKDAVDKKRILKLMPSFAGSFITVLTLLLLYYPPSTAALSGIFAMIVLSFLQGEYRPKLKTFIEGVKNGLEVVVPLSVLLIAIGPIAQMATVTNIAGKLSSVLSHVLPPNIILILMGTMVVSIIMGTGLPTPVAYLVVALTLVPFLQSFDLVVPLTAHLFCFYFAVYSTISPPVAISCMAASKLSGGTFWGTAREALRIALPTFLIPYAFVFNHQLLDFPRMSAKGIWIFIVTLIAMFFFSVGLFGFFRRKLLNIERYIALIFTGLAMVYLVNGSLALLVIFLLSGVCFVLWAILTEKRYKSSIIQNQT